MLDNNKQNIINENQNSIYNANSNNSNNQKNNDIAKLIELLKKIYETKL